MTYFNNNGTYQVDTASIMNMEDSLTNGHINRNIRASLVLIEMAKPYIDVYSIGQTKNSNQLELTFRVQGCI
jgi:hypothetical protein